MHDKKLGSRLVVARSQDRPRSIPGVATLVCRFTLILLPPLCVPSAFGGNLLVNGDFEAPAILGPGQTQVGPGQFKSLFGDPEHPGYTSGIEGIEGWINSFTDVGFGAGFRDAGLSRIDFDGSGDTQYAFINNWETRLSQVTPHVVASNESYSASIDVYLSPRQGGRLQLWAGEPSVANPDVFADDAVLLAELSVGSADWTGFIPDVVVPTSQWFRVELDYLTPPSGPMLGSPLTLSVLTSAGSAGAILWDNADLQAAAVPEPSTWAMAVVGVALLTFLVRRRAIVSPRSPSVALERQSTSPTFA